MSLPTANIAATEAKRLTLKSQMPDGTTIDGFCSLRGQGEITKLPHNLTVNGI
jgi:hypothetical protein